MTDLVVPCFKYIDLLTASLLSTRQIDDANEVALRNAKDAVLVGGEATSLETMGTRLRYRLMTGDAVRALLPWLDRLYRGPLLDLASEAFGTRMIPSTDETSGVNLNVLEGAGARYELHVDSNPLTGVIFLSDHSAETGGQLVFAGDGGTHVVNPRRGWLALFDARRVPHFVSPLRYGTRVCAPLNFYTEAGGVSRPDGLDRYLYEHRPKLVRPNKGTS